MGHERDEVAKCEGETGSQSSEGTHDKSTCFVLQMSQGDESQVRHFCGKFQISFYAGKDVAAKYTREGRGSRGRTSDHPCGVSDLYRFHRVKSCREVNRMDGLAPKAQVDAQQLISDFG